MKHVPQLDGVRCIAIGGVLVWHWIVWDTGNVIVQNIPWNAGVLLFFVLSGYLITGILLDLKDKIESKELSFGKALRNFYIRRFLRIFPIYYLLIFYLFYLNYDNIKEVFPWLVTYSSNLYTAFKGKFSGDYSHFWSLAVEEQFYIIWPFLILLVNRRHIFKTIIIVSAVSFLTRLVCVLCFAENWMMGSFFTPNLFIFFAMGGALAYYKKYSPAIFDKISTSKLFFYGSAIGYYLFYYFLTRKYNIVFLKALLDAILFGVFATSFVARAAASDFKFLGKYILEHRFVVYLGTISYGLYIYHMFMNTFFWYVVSPKLDLHTSLKFTYWTLYFLSAIVLSTVSFYLIEKPINSLKRYFPN